MVEKKSLVYAMEEAQQLSLKHPNVTYYVLDKPRKRAVCSGSDWIRKERIMQGYSTYCTFTNGKLYGRATK